MEEKSKIIFNDLKEAFDRLFNPNNKKKHLYSKYDRRQGLKKGLNKLNGYIDATLESFANAVCDTSIDEIDGLMSKFTLHNYRIRYGIIPNNVGIDLTSNKANGVLKTINARIVEGLIYVAQRLCLNDQVEVSGPIDKDTPMDDFYFTKDTYHELKVIESILNKPLTLNHIIEYYKRCTDNGFLYIVLRIGNKVYDELGQLIKNCGYNLETSKQKNYK